MAVVVGNTKDIVGPAIILYTPVFAYINQQSCKSIYQSNLSIHSVNMFVYYLLCYVIF